jgi:rsbT antagonist protein RsbS
VTVPILKQGEVLVASIQAALSDRDLLELRDSLSDKIGRHRSRGVILDVTALDVLDSFASRTIRGIVLAARLRGADAVVVGIQPEVAISMVQLGLTFGAIPTAIDLEDGLLLLRQLRVSRRVY